MAIGQVGDVMLNGKPYMLVRSAGQTGSRGWKEEPAASSEIQKARRDVAREDSGEIRLSWPTKHRGYGEPNSTVEGRDYWGRNIDKRYPGQTTLARAVNSITSSHFTGLGTQSVDPKGMAELGGNLFLGFGRYIVKIDPTKGDTEAGVTATSFDANDIAAGVKVKDLAVFKSKLYAAFGESYSFRESNGSTTWTGVSENICTNGTFETNTTGWTTSGTNTITTSGTQAHGGSLSCIATYNDNAVLMDYAATLSNASHVVTVWVYVPQDYDGGGIALKQLNNTVATSETAAVMTTRDLWQQVSLTYTPGADFTGNIQIINTGAAPTAGKFIYVDDVRITTAASVNGLKASLFRVAENRLYRIHSVSSSGASYLSNTTEDPMIDTNWSASDPIGDIMVDATKLVSLAYQLYIAKEDGLYAADTNNGRFPSLTPELASWRHANNGIGATGWSGAVFMPTIRGLRMYASGDFPPAGPEVMGSNNSEVKGRITALAGDANWLYAAMYNGTDTYILAGRPSRPDDNYPGDVVWNVVWYVSGGPYTVLHLSGISNIPKLWMASASALAYVKLGAALDNPLLDSTTAYASTGTDYYPAHDAGSPMVDKNFLELRVWSEQIDYGTYVTWSYKLDDASAWTPLATVNNISPVQVLKFDPAADVVGKKIALKAVYTRGATTTDTPVLRNVEVLAVEYPPTRKVVSLVTLVTDNAQLRVGSDSRKSLDVIQDLQTLWSTRKQIEYIDPVGRKYKALPLGDIMFQEAGQTDTRGPVGTVTLRLLTLP